MIIKIINCTLYSPISIDLKLFLKPGVMDLNKGIYDLVREEFYLSNYK